MDCTWIVRVLGDGLFKNIYLFGCVESWLWHVGSSLCHAGSFVALEPAGSVVLRHVVSSFPNPGLNP